MTLGDKLLKLRKEKGFSQEELGNRIGVTRQTISNWELGETNPNPEQLKLLSKEYKVSIDEILDNDVEEILFKKISNTERNTKLTLQIIKIFFIIFILLILILYVCKVIRSSKDTGREIEESIYCSIYGEEHSLNIVYEELTGQPIALGGDSYFIDVLDLNKYNDAHQIFNIINDYVKKNGGTCEMIEERNLNDIVDISIKDGTLTKNGLTIIIKEKEDYDISYGESFWIEKYNYKTSSFEKLENNNNNNCAFNAMAYFATTDKPLELVQSWSCMYGELTKGLYRLVKDVFLESDIPITPEDYYQIWLEFEIE